MRYRNLHAANFFPLLIWELMRSIFLLTSFYFKIKINSINNGFKHWHVCSLLKNNNSLSLPLKCPLTGGSAYTFAKHRVDFVSRDLNRLMRQHDFTPYILY